MADQWDQQRADGTLDDFWGSLPKESSDKKLEQDDQAMRNVKRLYKRDNAMSEILDQGLLQAIHSNVASSSSSSSTNK
ncbi:hypothetical protein BGZ65_007647, partial [Modicella reniformis]